MLPSLLRTNDTHYIELDILRWLSRMTIVDIRQLTAFEVEVILCLRL